ncbi:hypothetical protein D3C84_851000 [compost metagenome]
MFEVGLGLQDILVAVFGLRIRALEDEQVERGKRGLIETQRPTTIRHFPRQVGASPVQYRHEVVAHDIEAAARKVAHALLVVGDVLVTPTTAALDVFMHRNAFHHRPAQACGFDHLFARRDGVHRPDFAIGDFVQRGDDTGRTGLADVRQGDRVFGPKPTPCLFHVFLLSC